MSLFLLKKFIKIYCFICRQCFRDISCFLNVRIEKSKDIINCPFLSGNLSSHSLIYSCSLSMLRSFSSSSFNWFLARTCHVIRLSFTSLSVIILKCFPGLLNSLLRSPPKSPTCSKKRETWSVYSICFVKWTNFNFYSYCDQ